MLNTYGHIYIERNPIIPNNLYNPLLPTTGISGSIHASAAEAMASFLLAPLGIVKCDDYYPETFLDADRKPYKARSDFIHSASGVPIEFKCTERLNGLRTLASADKALARLRREEMAGYVNDGNRQRKMLNAAWSESIKKLAGVVAVLTPAKVVLLLADEPDAKEHRRLIRHGIFYRTMKDMPAYALFLLLASQGLDVGFSTDSHAFSVAPITSSKLGTPDLLAKLVRNSHSL